jgi:hypothetical protein
MSLTFSTMLELGTPAPDFSLPDVVSGKTISLATFADKPALLVLFICRHCPFVRHVRTSWRGSAATTRTAWASSASARTTPRPTKTTARTA